MMLTSMLMTVALLNPVQEQPKDLAPLRFNEDRQYQLKDLETTKLLFKEKHEIVAWVMDTNPKRAEGMMHLQDRDFTEKQGMIFVFARPLPLSFWMRNTLVDLDIAYVSPEGRIVKTYTMKALDETSDYGSKGDAKYAIELKAGWLKKHGVQTGDFVAISSRVKSKD